MTQLGFLDLDREPTRRTSEPSLNPSWNIMAQPVCETFNVKARLHQRAKLRTEPCNVTNLYIYTMKTNQPSTNRAYQQTIWGDPHLVGFSATHKGICEDM